MKLDPVAWHDRLAKPGLVDAHEIKKRRLSTGRMRVDAQNPSGLGHALDQKDAGHDRALREMPLELRLVDADILDADAEFVAPRLDHAVDHQKWIAVRQGFQQAQNVKRFDRYSLGLVHSARSPWRQIATRPFRWRSARRNGGCFQSDSGNS